MLFERAEGPLQLVGAPSVCQIAIPRFRLQLLDPQVPAAALIWLVTVISPVSTDKADSFSLD